MPLRNNRVVFSVILVFLFCLILSLAVFLFSNQHSSNTSNSVMPTEKVMVTVAPPSGDSFQSGIVFIAPNQSTILFTAKIDKIYQKDNKIFANLLIAQNNQEISVPFVLYPTSKSKFVIQKQISQTIFPSVKSKDVSIPFSTAMSTLNQIRNKELAFLAIVSLPNIKVSTPFDPYFACNKNLLQLLQTKSDLHALSCQPFVSQAKEYVQSL